MSGTRGPEPDREFVPSLEQVQLAHRFFEALHDEPAPAPTLAEEMYLEPTRGGADEITEALAALRLRRDALDRMRIHTSQWLDPYFELPADAAPHERALVEARAQVAWDLLQVTFDAWPENHPGRPADLLGYRRTLRADQL
ncbi:hypothetical protein [Streptomyces sp. TLI_171]|uniref:hypothetical protein n=1 Tax=Streptomyces sp. TLI_171 TaxID=1938859 RepID=UPI000C4797FB|nr:hypothetical protein [Streptomyces sp. TLI_171]RKE02909.1 hypothetical protein BX266_7512 [Streptomyces sp. TLI_171]